MAQAIGDPEEITRFANDLSRYVENLRSETGALGGSFANLGDTWQDEKRAAFEEEFNALVNQISQFESVCEEQHIPYLHALAARLQEYLQS